MQKEVVFITGNERKIAIAKEVLAKYNITLNHIKLDAPEIQAADVADVAKYSAKWAAEKLQKAVVVSDVSWSITALNGFPGTYMKDIAKMLGTNGFLKLMAGETNREIIFTEVLAYCAPRKEPTAVTDSIKAQLATTAEKNDNTNWAIDQIVILNRKLLAQMTLEERNKYFLKLKTWDKLAKIILEQ